MKVSALIFRYRMIVMAAIIFMGFWAPWVQLWAIGSRTSLLEWLALELTRAGLLSFTVATPVVIVTGACVAAAGVVLRIWGSACLGPGIVIDARMQAAALTVNGPYRHLRNPLYLGMYCWVAAMSLIMPASGALFVLIAFAALVFALIRGEESFLAAKIGEPYQAYLRSVPRIFPRMRSSLAPTSNKPRWGKAILSEINPIGIFVTIAFLSWTYDHELLIRAIIVTFGLSLLVRAFMPRIKREPSSPG